MKIKRWDTGEVIISGDETSLLELVERAVRERKSLVGADLISADLRSANLSSADLRYANLIYANLRSANLRSANLRSADLRYANLIYANLRSANLRSANLSCADLSSANLSSANLSFANLISANLRSADLSSANLISADLRYANLSCADLSSANLSSADLPNFSIVPDAGSFTVWKKVKNQTGDPVILELLVPADAQRVSSLVGRKCRVSCARPIQATAIDGTVFDQSQTWYSTHDKSFTYQIGTLAQVENFDNDIRVECAPGIHCFITRKEACEY